MFVYWIFRDNCDNMHARSKQGATGYLEVRTAHPVKVVDKSDVVFDLFYTVRWGSHNMILNKVKYC